MSVLPKNVLIVGGGEHAQVVAEAALSRPELWSLEGFVDIDSSRRLRNLPHLPNLGWDHALITLSSDSDCWSVLGVGATRSSDRRRQIIKSFDGSPVRWASIVHARAWVSPTATIRPGAVVFAGAVVNAGAILGEHSVINTGSVIEHDVTVGDFVMVSPGTVVGGGTILGENCFIGLGARIRDHVTIGAGATVGMGAVVVKNVAAGTTVTGVPARRFTPERFRESSP